MSDLPNYLPGVPPMYGVKQPCKSFPQGNDIVIEFDLELDGEPILDVSTWLLEAFIKKSVIDIVPLWTGTLGEGIYKKEGTANRYFVRVSHHFTATLKPNTYHLVVRASQRPGTGNPFDRVSTIVDTIFTTHLDASAPKPTGDVVSYVNL